jgi:hypothetical protein
MDFGDMESLYGVLLEMKRPSPFSYQKEKKKKEIRAGNWAAKAISLSVPMFEYQHESMDSVALHRMRSLCA